MKMMIPLLCGRGIIYVFDTLFKSCILKGNVYSDKI